MKYELTAETKQYNGVTVYRIRALTNFDNITAGTLGGWVESEANLSHEDNAWIADEAIAIDNALVTDNAKLFGNAVMVCQSKLIEGAWAYGNALLQGDTTFGGTFRVSSGTFLGMNYDNNTVKFHSVAANAEVMYTGTASITTGTTSDEDAAIILLQQMGYNVTKQV